ncbi:hypothetical protein PO78_4289 [Thauera sp. SWB20]|nr:hypothetical protein PO78_4289 [Thauera sp. SWB20]
MHGSHGDKSRTNRCIQHATACKAVDQGALGLVVTRRHDATGCDVDRRLYRQQCHRHCAQFALLLDSHGGHAPISRLSSQYTLRVLTRQKMSQRNQP